MDAFKDDVRSSTPGRAGALLALDRRSIAADRARILSIDKSKRIKIIKKQTGIYTRTA